MRYLIVAIGMLCAGSAFCATFGRVRLVSFTPEADIFEARWNPDTTILCRDGGLTVESVRKRTLTMDYARFPGCKPFPGPRRIVMKTDGGFSGSAELHVAELQGGRPHVFSAVCRKTAVFETGLPATTAFQLKRIVLRFDGAVPETGWNVRLQELEGTFDVSEAAACEMDVDTGDPLHLCDGDGEEVRLVLRNVSDRDLRWTGEIALSDLTGHSRTLPLGVRVRSGESVRLPLGGPLPGRGLWRCYGKVRGEDGSVAYPETRFAVVDRHEVGPALPDGTFRIGLNYHYGRYSPFDRRLTMRALVASGAKHARVDAGMWRLVQRSGPDEWNWTESDAMVDDFERHGMTLDSIVWGCPKWAATPERQTNAHWFVWAMGKPAKDHLSSCERYYESLSRRYGTRIAYYELGNEWDLQDPAAFTVDEAVDIQKLVSTAIKRGCPKAFVIPNGWGVWDSKSAANRIAGFPEEVMRRAHGHYDAHPIHNHGPFSRYRRQMLERFLPRRRDLGIDDVPWYSNETGLSSVHGNEVPVAENVWKKILFAFAYGSRDYVWYNLKATGWNPKDPEQGYGLMTADYYPRAGYAAFAALTSAVGGLARDGVLKSTGLREVFRFTGDRGAGRETVLAGWDDGATDGPIPLHVTTDAAAAVLVDFMGNRTNLVVRSGDFVWPLQLRPTAVILRGSRADVTPEDLDAVSLGLQRPIRAGKDAGRPPDLVVDKVAYVNGFFEANPATVGRVWKGPDDNSFAAWFDRADEFLDIRVRVCDDKHVQHAAITRKMSEGDCLRLTVSVPGQEQLWELGFRLTENLSSECCVWNAPAGFAAAESSIRFSADRVGRETTYRIALPLRAMGITDETLGLGLGVALRTDDNDGEGRDLWMGLETPVRLILP